MSLQDHQPPASSSSLLYGTQQASEYLLTRYGIPRAPSTLNKLRVVGGGPAYRKIGTLRVGYERESLDVWAASTDRQAPALDLRSRLKSWPAMISRGAALAGQPPGR